jgi:hypothetical protein
MVWGILLQSREQTEASLEIKNQNEDLRILSADLEATMRNESRFIL